MTSVDSRIVTLKFDNTTFAQKVSTTLDLLKRLKESLNFSKSKKGMDDLQNTANKLNLNPLASSIQGASAKFLALSTVAITALSNIVNKAVDAGIRIVKSLSLDPVMDGFREYETNMNSIQTILANTKAAGSTLGDVNSALQELNEYSDQTIYNFSEMAKNIGTFTAAGVNLETATGSIKGIANLAALSGSNSQQASTAMYQLSQAISSGKVSLMDWNSVVNAGMGGTVFQRALAETAVAMGKIDESALKLDGDMKNVKINGESFRDSISAEGGGASWLSSDVLTATLQQFTGDLSDAELAAQGFNEAQIAAIKETAQTAKSAATEVKTISQLMGTLKESAGSGWMQSFQLILGDFEQAKATFTAVNDTLGGMIGASADARNKLLGDFVALGGRTVLIDTIATAFKNVMAVVNVVKGAFRDIFPPATGAQLFVFVTMLSNLAKSMQMGSTTAINLSRTFRGFFAALSIGWEILKGFGRIIIDIFGEFDGAGDGLLGFTGNIGDFLVELERVVKEGEGFREFFRGLSTVLQAPVIFIKNLAAGIKAFFEEFVKVDPGLVADGFGRMGERLNPLVGTMDKVRTAADLMGKMFARIGEIIQPVVEKIAGEFAGLGAAISEAMGGGSFDKVLDLINTGLLGAIAVMVMKFFNGGMNIDVGGGLFEKIGGTFDALNNSLTALQTNIQSKTLMNIAIAVGILAASMVALSLIDSEKLAAALGAMGVGFAQLLGAMAVLIKIGGAAGFIQIPLIATAMVSLATAVLILSGAIAVLAQFSWEELAVGMAGIAGAMGILVGAAVLLGKFAGPGLIAAGIGMQIMANALLVMSGVVAIFSTLSWEELGQGLAGVASLLAIVVGAMTLMPPNMVATAVAMNLLAVALGLMAGVVYLFATMGIETVMEGLVGVAAALGLIAGAMTLMPPNMLIQAVALIGVAAALGLIADAVGKMGGMTWEEIGKGMVVLAGSLAILAAALYLMTGAALGAVALIVAAGALAIIAPVLVTLGGLSWEEIGKGLVALAGAFVVIGLAGLVLTPILPSLLLLGGAVLLLGAGAALAGLGVLAFGTGFTLLVAAFAAGTGILVGGVTALINLIPLAMVGLANGLIAFAAVISTAGPAITAAFVTLLTSLLDAVIAIAPKLMEALGVLLDEVLALLVEYVPKIADAALELLIGLVEAFTDNVDMIVTAVTALVTAFIQSLAENAPKFANSAAEALIDFMDGMTAAINRNAGRLQQSGRDLAKAIIDGMTGGLGSGLSSVVSKAKEVAQGALNAAKSALGINSPSKEFFDVGMYSDQGLANGLIRHAGVVDSAAEKVGERAIDTIKKSMVKIAKLSPEELNVAPVVRPVIDLSDIRKGSSEINKLFGNTRVAADLTSRDAQLVAAGMRKLSPSSSESASVPTDASVKLEFKQYNTSPEKLSEAEIYRRTNNQLSQAKKALEGAGKP